MSSKKAHKKSFRRIDQIVLSDTDSPGTREGRVHVSKYSKNTNGSEIESTALDNEETSGRFKK